MNSAGLQIEIPAVEPLTASSVETPISGFVNRTKSKGDHFTLCVRRGEDGGVEEPLARYSPSADLDARIWADAERRARGFEASSVAFVLRAHKGESLVAARSFALTKEDEIVAMRGVETVRAVVEGASAGRDNRASRSPVSTWVRQPVSSMNRATAPGALLLREADDPIEDPPSETIGGPERSWADVYGEVVPAVWSHRIAKRLADGVPRTFHRIMIELTGFGADTCVGTAAEVGVWNLVDAGEIAHTLEAPILFSAIEHSTVEAAATACVGDSVVDATPISEGPEGSIDTSP